MYRKFVFAAQCPMTTVTMLVTFRPNGSQCTDIKSIILMNGMVGCALLNLMEILHSQNAIH